VEGSAKIGPWQASPGERVEMNKEPLYLIIGAPMLFNAVAYINAKFDGMNEIVTQQFKAIDMRDLWRSER
jgi:hypothetical protein